MYGILPKRFAGIAAKVSKRALESMATRPFEKFVQPKQYSRFYHAQRLKPAGLVSTGSYMPRKTVSIMMREEVSHFLMKQPSRQLSIKPKGLNEENQQVTSELRPHETTHDIPFTKFISKNGEVPITFSQQCGIKLSQGNAVTIPSAMHFHGIFNQSLFEKALTLLVSRYDNLRTIVDRKRKVQIIKPKIDLPLEKIDLSEEGESQEDQVQNFLKNEALIPFDLMKGPLIRFKLIHLNDNHHIFCFFVHHTILDGVAIVALLKELQTIYNAYVKGALLELPLPRYQFKDFANWQNLRNLAGLYDTTLKFWENQLAKANQQNLFNLDYERPISSPSIRNDLSSEYVFPLPNVYNELNSLSKKCNVSLFTVMMAAYYTFIYQHSKVTDIVICSPAANRSHPEFVNLSGCLASYMPYCLKLNVEHGFINLVTQIREIILEAKNFEDYPFDKLMDNLDAIRGREAPSIWQTSFTLYRSFPSPENLSLSLTGIKTQPISIGMLMPRERDMHFFVSESNEQLQGRFVYQQDLFMLSTIEQLAENYNKLLKKIIKNPDQTINELVSDKKQFYNESKHVVPTTKRGFFTNAQADEIDKQQVTTTENISEIRAKRF